MAYSTHSYEFTSASLVLQLPLKGNKYLNMYICNNVRIQIQATAKYTSKFQLLVVKRERKKEDRESSYSYTYSHIG